MTPKELGPGVWLHDPMPWWLSFYEGRTLIGSFHVRQFQNILALMSQADIRLLETSEAGKEAG